MIKLKSLNVDGTVTLTQEEYLDLMMDSDFLQGLRDRGVDNWEGYVPDDVEWEEDEPENGLVEGDPDGNW